MKNGFRLLSAAALSAAVIGCPNPAHEIKKDINAGPQSAELILEKVRKDLKIDANFLYTADRIIPDSPEEVKGILLIAHGGPEYELFPMSRFEYLKAPDKYSRVLVKQNQMVEGRVPLFKGISKAKAREINLHSAAAIFAVAEDFEKKVYDVVLYASSFGAFLAVETLRRYGHEPFTKILIARGRLDMPKELTESRFEGILKSFMDGRELVTIWEKGCTGPRARATGRGLSMYRLQADLNQHEYTKMIPEDALRKIIYYSGGKDNQVGGLTEDEVSFLTGRSPIRELGPDNAGEGYEKREVVSRGIVHEWIESKGSGIGCTKVGIRKNVTREIHIIQSLKGKKAVVKYAPCDDHGIPSLSQEIQKDIRASFSD